MDNHEFCPLFHNMVLDFRINGSFIFIVCSIWSSYMMLLICCWIWLLAFWWRFSIYVFKWYWSVVSFLSDALLKKFFNYYYYFWLYNIVWILPYINMHPPQVYTCSQSWTLLPPPAPYHPSGSSQCISPKLPVSCIEPGLAIRFLHDIIHVSMPFSQIIPPLPLPQSPKDCSIHLCLFCCLSYRVVVTIFLNSIYMC